MVEFERPTLTALKQNLKNVFFFFFKPRKGRNWHDVTDVECAEGNRRANDGGASILVLRWPDEAEEVAVNSPGDTLWRLRALTERRGLSESVCVCVAVCL